MRTESPPVPLLPFVAAQPLTDHHCHGVLRTPGGLADLKELLTEGEGGRHAGGTAFDSLAGLAFRRWCPPLLGLSAHAPIEDYAARRAEFTGAEVNRRFLAASGLSALLVDTGFQPAALLSPAELSGLAGAAAAVVPRADTGAGTPAFEIVRLEQVAETLADHGVAARAFPDAYRAALAARVASPAEGVPVVGVKSIAAYRVGLDLGAERPSEAEVAAAAARWLGAQRPADGTPAGARAPERPPRVADETLHRFFIWCGADLGLPIQFHVGYGDRDIDLHRCNPLLLTPLLRAIEPAGVPVMLLHNYPYHREAGYLAQVFPHVYADLGLITHNAGSRAPALLAEALELTPLRKFLFSSDAFGLPELYYLSAMLFRQGLSGFLRTRLDDGDLSLADAERLTRLIATDNARRAYRLPAP